MVTERMAQRTNWHWDILEDHEMGGGTAKKRNREEYVIDTRPSLALSLLMHQQVMMVKHSWSMNNVVVPNVPIGGSGSDISCLCRAQDEEAVHCVCDPSNGNSNCERCAGIPEWTLQPCIMRDETGISLPPQKRRAPSVSQPQSSRTFSPGTEA